MISSILNMFKTNDEPSEEFIKQVWNQHKTIDFVNKIDGYINHAISVTDYYNRDFLYHRGCPYLTSRMINVSPGIVDFLVEHEIVVVKDIMKQINQNNYQIRKHVRGEVHCIQAWWVNERIGNAVENYDY